MKIEIKKIESLSSRRVAFSKRRMGLFKKASELCVRCDTEIAIIVQSLGKHIHSFGHNSTDAVIDRYLGGGDAPAVDSNTKELYEHCYSHVVKELELEKKRRDVAEEAKKTEGGVFWWNQGEEEMELDEMEQFAMALDELSKKADLRANDLMSSCLQQQLAVASTSASAPNQMGNNLDPN